MAGGCVLPSWVWAWYMPTTVPEKVNTVAISPLKILVQWVNPHLLVLSSYIPSSFLYASDVSDDITHIDKYADNISICSPEVHILKWEKNLVAIAILTRPCLRYERHWKKNDSTTMEALASSVYHATKICFTPWRMLAPITLTCDGMPHPSSVIESCTMDYGKHHPGFLQKDHVYMVQSGMVMWS